MRSAQTPKAAMWLLRHFGCGPNNEVVAGDLVEQYVKGHTRTWFWRQALLAILIGLRTEVSSHKGDSARAVVSVWSALVLWAFLMSDILTVVFSSQIGGKWLLEGNVVFLVGLLVLLAISGCVAGGVSGWLLKRFHRPHHRARVLLLAGSLILVAVAAIGLTWQTTGAMLRVQGIHSPNVDVWISPRVWIYTAGNPMTILSLLLGGGIFRPGAEAPVQEGPA